tara:strand:+ start:83 stop:511 length:429 start_codon:yes stop_codon:yes gene_type:complete
MADEQHVLYVQHELIPADVREALASALLNASVQGHAGFNRVILTIMAYTASGKVAPEQAEWLTKQCELLFTNLMAMQIQQSQTDGGDPLYEQLKAAQAGARKVRPDLLIEENGASSLGLQMLEPDGRTTDIVRVDIPAPEGE